MKFCLRIFLLLLVVTGTLTDDGFDLGDALGDPDPTPPKPKEQPEDKPKSDGGFDLFEALDPDHQPYTDKPAVVPPKNGGGGADPSAQAGSGQIAGIASAIGMALLGAASSYFAYQKKKLCFKIQGGADPESGKDPRGTNSDPQVLSNLLRTN